MTLIPLPSSRSVFSDGEKAQAIRDIIDGKSRSETVVSLYEKKGKKAPKNCSLIANNWWTQLENKCFGENPNPTTLRICQDLDLTIKGEGFVRSKKSRKKAQ